MNRIIFLLSVVILFWEIPSFGQVYRPMPTDSAIWRYRIVINDDVLTVNDFILYVNGEDTVINGKTYYKIYSRSNNQIDTVGSYLPIVPVIASGPDLYFGGIREANKRVYYVSAGPEELIFDFNATVGTYIPASLGTVRVDSIDSVLIGSFYHKRYLTADSTYYVIEGVGSNRGLIPDFNDGSGQVTFHCFTHEPDTTWSPDTTIPCTVVYPYVKVSVKTIDKFADVNVYPNPANEKLHVANTGAGILNATILNDMGQTMWKGEINNCLDIPVSRWPGGVYYMQFRNDMGSASVKKIVVE